MLHLNIIIIHMVLNLQIRYMINYLLNLGQYEDLLKNTTYYNLLSFHMMNNKHQLIIISILKMIISNNYLLFNNNLQIILNNKIYHKDNKRKVQFVKVIQIKNLFIIL
eukprot:UN03609